MASDATNVSDTGLEATSTFSPVASPPVIGREVVAVALWTLFADLFIFRSFGYLGPALFLALVPVLFRLGCPDWRSGLASRITVSLIVVVAARLAWQGSELTIFSGLLLVVALSMTAAGHFPCVIEGIVVAGRAIVDGTRRVTHYRTPQLAIGKRPINTTGSLAWFLPLGAALIFGSIFVLANPDVLDWVSHRISRVLDRMSLWLGNVSVWEVLFCILALLLGAGLMRPLLPILTTDRIDPTELAGEPTAESPLFAAFRNTLLTLIALFTVYLLFEFATLWKRDFPEGFYYAGYAHQGAAWLTCALALATVLLSVMFSGTMLRDPRVGSLRRLAWVWSVANLLLAAAVYNRLLIYVGYNGMTRMRSVGFFGITVVVIGFVLVLYKIRSQRNFWWLVRTQLIALVLTIITYSVFPVDYVMHRYNANAISAGYLRPAVMVAVKPIGNEGYFPLIELVDSDDEIIRNGVRAMLAEKQLSLENAAPSHWTRWQWSAQRLRDQLQEEQTRWSSFADPAKRDQAIERFRDYAMQWY